MKKVNYYIDCFLTTRFFVLLSIIVLLFVISYYVTAIWAIAVIAAWVALSLVVLDYLLLFRKKIPLNISRHTNEKFSNGDNNDVLIKLQNLLNIKLDFILIDEIPLQFGIRDFELLGYINGHSNKDLHYTLRPTKRGSYIFENLVAFINTPLNLVERRCTFLAEQKIKVYPSFLQIRDKHLKGVVNLENVGESKLKKFASSMEFDHIKEYSQGDDIRNINWKATARKGSMMVNTYMDERSQQIYCAIDMGRVMKMPFEKMTLLDYSINAALMLSFTILNKNDKAGIITFAEKRNDFLKAEKNKSQITKITDCLFKQETNYLESNYEALMNTVKYQVGQRSLILLFTNFETMSALDRVMPYLKSITKKHLLSVIIFENTELKQIHDSYKNTMEGIYVKTIADRFMFEKKRISKELNKEGILNIFTTPQNLSSNVINQYLDLKNKRIL
jgi:uncharacterized protein (DUF58 family)